MVLFLSNEDVQKLLTWSEAVRVCEDVLWERSRGTAWFSPRERFVLPTGSVFLLLPGGATGSGFMGTRAYSQQPRANKTNKTSHVLNAHAVNIVLDMKSAEILALTAGEWINTLRTTAVAAAGAKYLARKDSRRVGVFGSGMLAFGSLMTLKEVFPLAEAKVFSRNPEHRNRFCSKLSDLVGFPVRPVDAPEEVLREVDLVVTATSSMEPVFDGRLLGPGIHVNSIGGYVQGGGRELDENAMSRFHALAILNKEHATKGGVWEDRPNRNFAVPVEKGLLTWDRVVEIAEIMAGRAKGRQSDSDITLYDSRGMGAFDLALAYRAYELAHERGFGKELDWGKRPTPGWQ